MTDLTVVADDLRRIADELDPPKPVRLPPALMGRAEAAKALGVAGPNLARVAGLPDPIVRLSSGPVWDGDAIMRVRRERDAKHARVSKALANDRARREAAVAASARSEAAGPILASDVGKLMLTHAHADAQGRQGKAHSQDCAWAQTWAADTPHGWTVAPYDGRDRCGFCGGP